MLEKPDLPDGELLLCLREDYGVQAVQLDFLPLGADRRTAVYRASSVDSAFFVKLRSGHFEEATVTVPDLLRAQGVEQVIAPLRTVNGGLWTTLQDFHVILYPFVEGQDGFARDLSAAHWIELGRALQAIHRVALPAHIAAHIPQETFSAQWRTQVQRFQALVEVTAFDDPLAAELAVFMRAKRHEIRALVEAAQRLADYLQAHPLPPVLCHADIHIGNVLITPTDRLYVVDWDTVIQAPTERDLMFMGMGMADPEHLSADQQEALFYEGYGSGTVNGAALAYYRCERIVQDAFEYGQHILFTHGASPDRAEGLRQFQGQFKPERVVARALQTVERLAPDFL